MTTQAQAPKTGFKANMNKLWKAVSGERAKTNYKRFGFGLLFTVLVAGGTILVMGFMGGRSGDVDDDVISDDAEAATADLIESELAE